MRISLKQTLNAIAIGAITSWQILALSPVRAEVRTGLAPVPLWVSTATTAADGFVPPLGSAADFLPQVFLPQVFLPQTDAITDTHLLLDLSERTLYLYRRGAVLDTFPVAVGRQGWETPTGRFTVFQMQQNPVWEHPFTGELVPPGDTNPLGHRWIGFWSDGTNAIGFHGTPQEASIGQAVSHGCVRLYNRDVLVLYEQVAIGTPVYVTP